jgi:hypothetical protein
MLATLLALALSACTMPFGLPRSEAAEGAPPASLTDAEEGKPAGSLEAAEVDDGTTDGSQNTPTMPVLTESHQGFVYGPGQMVIVFAERFEAGERLSVSAMHESEGMVKSAQAEANVFGQLIIYHWVQESPEAEGAYPPGKIVFWVTGDSGIVKEYAFSLDYGLSPQSSAFSGCGAYPPEPVLGGSFVAWCTGLAPTESYQTDFAIQSGGEIILEGDQADLTADGVGLLLFSSEVSDPLGTWTITIGGQPFDINVISNH